MAARNLLRIALGVTSIAVVLAGACAETADVARITCDAGTNIFCRCDNGDSGTRECAEDSSGFGECVIAPGVPCGERVDCEEGDKVDCVCPDDTPGYKECLRDGTSYGHCEIAPYEPCPTSSSSGTGGSGAGTSSGGGSGGSNLNCGHDKCETGDPLSAGCDDCTTAVCAADDYCCTTKWDNLCLDVVNEECDGLCGGGTGGSGAGTADCSHSVCEVGVALLATCDACTADICADDYWGCCDTEYDEDCDPPNTTDCAWDSVCVGFAEDMVTYPACAGFCGCIHDECEEGVKLDPTCSDCAAAVCTTDDFCCDDEWDALCVSYAYDETACSCS